MNALHRDERVASGRRASADGRSCVLLLVRFRSTEYEQHYMQGKARLEPKDDKLARLSSLNELILAVQRRSRPALKRLYELEGRRLFGVALRIVRRSDIAADVLQDAFLQIWEKALTFSPDRGEAAAWLTSIVRYRAIDAVRRTRRELLVEDAAPDDLADEPDVLGWLDRYLAKHALRRCLDKLDDNQRRCIALAFVNGLTHAEIADRLAAPLGSVKSWVRRGLMTLRSCLES